MRTKALVLAAVLAAGSAVTGLAQTVYSINAVGYVNLTIPNGFSMIANPLNTTNNTLGSLFGANVPDFTTIYKWNGVAFQSATFLFGACDQPNFTLAPGEGCFINATAAFTNTFVGEVIQSPDAVTAITNALPAGFSIVSSKVPQEATLSALGLNSAMSDFDTVYRYSNVSGAYTSSTFLFGAWDNDATVAVGEAFWVNASVAKPWTRIFQVNTP